MKQLEKYIIVALFSVLVILCFLQIVFRFALNFSLSWTEELARYVFVLLVYMSACAAILQNAHVRVEIIDSLIPARFKKPLDTAVDLLFMAFMALVGYYGVQLSIEAFRVEQTTPALQAPMGLVYAIIPITFFLTCIRLIQRIVLRYKTAPPETDTGS